MSCSKMHNQSIWASCLTVATLISHLEATPQRPPASHQVRASKSAGFFKEWVTSGEFTGGHTRTRKRTHDGSWQYLNHGGGDNSNDDEETDVEIYNSDSDLFSEADELATIYGTAQDSDPSNIAAAAASVSSVKTQHDPEHSKVDDASSSSQPLRTLKKLQAMLEETDYATTTSSSQKRNRNPNSHAPLSHQKRGGSTGAPLPVLPPDLPSDDGGDDAASDALSDVESLLQTNKNAKVPPPPPPPPKYSSLPPKLWASQDRSKYKRQQQKQRMLELEELEKQRREWKNQHQASYFSDDETDVEDGLGYTLPNLPVYLSDGEPADFDPPRPDGKSQQAEQKQPSQVTKQHPKKVEESPRKMESLKSQISESKTAEQHLPPSQGAYTGYPYGPQYHGPYQPYPPPPPQQQQAQYYPPYPQQNPYYAQPYGPAGAYAQHYQPLPHQGYSGYRPGMFPPPPYGYSGPPQRPHVPSFQVTPGVTKQRTVAPRQDASLHPPKSFTRSPVQEEALIAVTEEDDLKLRSIYQEKVSSLAEAGSRLSFDSCQKLVFAGMCVMVLSYCAVSPRTASAMIYNKLFKQNLQIVALIVVAPILTLMSVFDAASNDINSIVSTFYNSCTMGYCFTFLLEIGLATVLRLIVFAVWEPEMFSLTPEVPLLMLPWTLRENQYRPRRITLFAADFLTSCVASTLVEEWMKLKVLEWSVRLPKNFNAVKRKQIPSQNARKRRRKKPKTKLVLEPVMRRPGEHPVTNINSYVAHMLASSLGLKLADSVRRALMYTKSSDAHKGFYALMRGIFPIHELCGTLTALQLARRDVLGLEMPLWKLIFPAAFIHGMANFRGMKPIFKWNSSTPWSEMQMSPWNMADDSTFFQIISKGFGKFMWVVLLGRVLGYCIKNYYMICRQAVKRTTTYASNRAAFSAELEAAELLKKSKAEK